MTGSNSSDATEIHSSNVHRNGSSNGHSNGQSNGHSNGHSSALNSRQQRIETSNGHIIDGVHYIARENETNNSNTNTNNANNPSTSTISDNPRNVMRYSSLPNFGYAERSIERIFDEDMYPYEVVQEIAEFLLKGSGMCPKVGIICGSGLGSLAELIKDQKVFEYEKIPNFPVSTVEGHAGRLIFGNLEGMAVMAMQGRFHFYEGYPLAKCSMPVRVMKLCGVEYLFATNAAGGINPKYQEGDIMIMHDHVNMLGLAGNSPLQGPNDPRFGPRFPALTNAYNKDLINKALEIVKTMGFESNCHVGVYSCLGGPTYETIAELKALRVLGVDAVGMSTVHEVITARHCDMKVFAFSLITNKCQIEYDQVRDVEANHEEVMAVAKKRQKTCGELVSRLIHEICNEQNN